MDDRSDEYIYNKKLRLPRVALPDVVDFGSIILLGTPILTLAGYGLLQDVKYS